MIRLVSRVVAAATMATAALVALPATAHAANGCSGDPYNVNILTSPVRVDVVAAVPSVNYGWARVCVGNHGDVAYQEFGLVAHPYGWLGPAACNLWGAPDQYTGVGTGDVTSVAGFTFFGGVGVATAPQLCLGDAGHYSISLPVTICSNLCVSNGPRETGVVVGSFSVTGGPGGTTGAGVHLNGVWLVLDGITIPIATPYASAGVGTGAVSAPTGSPIVCGPLNLVCVPGSAGIYYNGGPFAAIDVMMLGYIPVAIPGGAQCFRLFTIAPVGPAC